MRRRGNDGLTDTTMLAIRAILLISKLINITHDIYFMVEYRDFPDLTTEQNTFSITDNFTISNYTTSNFNFRTYFAFLEINIYFSYRRISSASLCTCKPTMLSIKYHYIIDLN